MQSVKYLIILAACSMASVVRAAPTTDLPPAPQPVQAPEPAQRPQIVTELQIPESQPVEQKSAETTMQEHIQKLIEQDYRNEELLRKLNNQVEVEKKLSEIRKLRGEDKIKAAIPVVAPVSPNKPAAAPEGVAKDKPSSPPPHVVLESVIGGLTRVAVVNNSGDKLLYVRPGETFAMDGKNYLLVRDVHLGLLIKDAAP